MDFDEKYLDELLKSIEPIVGADESEESVADESVPDVPEEELDSEIAEPLDMDEEPVLDADREAATVTEEAAEASEEAVPEAGGPAAELKTEAEEPVAEPKTETVEAAVVPETEEPAVEETAPALTIDDLDPEDGNKQLSADEIAALFGAANATVETIADESGAKPEPVQEESEPDTKEPVAEEAEPQELEAVPDAEADSVDELIGSEPSLSDLLAESDTEGALGEGEQEIDMDMSADEIDAMLNAARNAGNEPDDLEEADAADAEELLSLLASAGDEDLGDIQNLLESDEKGEAVDESALIAATTVEDVAAGVLDTPEEVEARAKEERKAAKQRAREEKKAARAARKAAKKGAVPAEGGEEGTEGTGDDAAAAQAPKKKSFLAGLISALTENLDDEVEEEEGKAGEEDGETEDGEIANISDENKEILAELDKEQGKKKGGKPKKEKKKKKKGKDGEEGEEAGGGAEEAEEGEDTGKKKKKKEKKKKEKAPKAEEVPSRPEKKLPKKRVRATFILCFSIMAGIIILTVVMTKISNLQEARYAYERQDYETAYEDLYGLELKGEDEEMFNKTQIMLLLDRKLRSYQNYRRLGMDDRALHALLEGVDMYPDILIHAEEYGVVPQVEYTYSQIKDALGTYGLSEDDAKEINAYDSQVKYTKRIDSIVHGTPFTYDEDIAREGGAPVMDAVEGSKPSQTMDDILPQETDFLPDDPNAIFDGTAPDAVPADALPADEIPTDEGNV